MGVVTLLALLFFHGVRGCDTGCVFQPVGAYSSYNGTVSQTINGKTCCNWTQSNQAAGIVAGTNYCRTRQTDRNAYCYVGNCAAPTLEYCDVGTYTCPICTNPVVTPTPSATLTYPCIAPQALASTEDSFVPRVVGGSNAIPHEFPFYVSIQRNGGVYCGGSLIHKDWVLTAAHCTFEQDGSATPASAYTLKIGTQKWSDTDSCVETRTVVSILKHPAYDTQTEANDLAFFKLSASSNYPPITLNYQGLTTENLEAEGLMASVIGHGTLSYGGSVALTLQKALVPIFNQANCQNYWSPYVTTQICAAYQQGGVDTCQGDSGGPMFVKRGTTFIQTGVTSFGNDCALPDSPGVYVRLSAYHAWICSSSLPAEICQATVAPTTIPTARPTTAVPTTLVPTTRVPTTGAPTKNPTQRPTTRDPTTRVPTTRVPTTPAPTTRVPTTRVPTTSVPTKGPTQRPTTRDPTTRVPTTRVPSTPMPTTRVPTTRVPTTSVPTKNPTQRPTTRVPTTRAPTPVPTTRSPTLKPTTRVPTTRVPTTSVPTKNPTQRPTTRAPTTRVPTTTAPTKNPTQRPTTRVPTTRSPTTAPTTRTPTLKPTTRVPTTRSPTSAPTTRTPTLKPTTRVPTTRSPTSAPTTRTPTLKPTTSEPTTRTPTSAPTTRTPTLTPTTGEPTTRTPTRAPSTGSPTVPSLPAERDSDPDLSVASTTPTQLFVLLLSLALCL